MALYRNVFLTLTL